MCSAASDALSKLRSLCNTINQTVGDALSDLLLVCAILANKQWTLADWQQAYTDLPSRLVKVVVKDRSLFKAHKADTELVAPMDVQQRIWHECKQVQRGRSFVRCVSMVDWQRGCAVLDSLRFLTSRAHMRMCGLARQAPKTSCVCMLRQPHRKNATSSRTVWPDVCMIWVAEWVVAPASFCDAALSMLLATLDPQLQARRKTVRPPSMDT